MRKWGAELVLVLLAAVGCGGSGQKAGRPTNAPGAGTSGFPGELRCWGGLGREAGRFVRPRAIAATGERLYVVDMSGRIQVFDLEGRWRATWELPEVSRGYPAGLGVRSFEFPQDRPGLRGTALRCLEGRADGWLAVADTHNSMVRLYSPEGTLLQIIGREGGGPGEFTYVRDAAFDAAGNMYVSEHGREDRIQKFDREGRFLLTWGRSGEGPGEFHRPEALFFDEAGAGGAGALYVADAANHRIQKFSSEGKLLAVWGGPGKGPGELLYPYGLTGGPGGLLFVAEFGNNRIQAFDAEGRSVAVWGRPGREPGEFSQPWGIEWVSGRGLYVVDAGNHRVQEFAGEGLARLTGRDGRPVADSGRVEPPVSE